MGTHAEREGVRDAFRKLFLSDREKGEVKEMAQYKGLFPGFWDVVGEEFDAIAREIQPGGRTAVAVPAVADTTPGPAVVGADAAPETAAERIGSYRILKELGRGGMGVVYLAEDTRIGRKVALKVLAAHFSSSRQLLLRFQREAELAGKLDHPHICTVYEAGEADGTAYMAMRLVEGKPLSEWIRQSKEAKRPSGVVTLPPLEERKPDSKGTGEQKRDFDRILQLIEKAARALHVAHEKGLIHRDIKPHNIMVTPEGEPVLLDFGLAREEEGEGQQLTQTGSLMGTPAYMSPEQLVTQRIRLDRRTDVYSLGVTLYECLTLRLPFEAPTLDALYQQILATDPENPRSLNQAIAPDLRVIVDTTLEKDRNRRYQTAFDVAEDLRRFREREPILARPVGPVGRLTRWSQRNRALAGSLALTFLVLAGGLATTTSLLSDARRERDAKDSLLERMRDDTRLKSTLLAQFRRPLKEGKVRVFPRTVIHEPSSEILHRPFFLPGGLRIGAFARTGANRGLQIQFLGLGGQDSTQWTFAAWDLDGNPVAPNVRWDGDFWNCPAVSPTGADFAVETVDSDGQPRIFDTEGRGAALCEGLEGYWEWLDNGEGIFAASLDRSVIYGPDGRVRRVFAGTPPGPLGGNPLVRGTASPSGKHMATIYYRSNPGLSPMIRVWNSMGSVTGEFQAPEGSRRFRWIDDERLLALPGEGDGPDPQGAAAGPARVLDVEGKILAVLGDESLPKLVDAVATSDGRRIVAQGWDRKVRIFDRDGGPPILLSVEVDTRYRLLHPPKVSRYWDLRLSPRGDMLAVLASGPGQRVTLWSIDGVELAELPMLGTAADACFSSDGDRLLVAESAGALVLWEILRETR